VTITNNDRELYKIVIYVRTNKEDEDYPNNAEPRSRKRLKDLKGVLVEYYVYLVFRKKIIDKLPNKTSFDYKIELKEGTELKYYKVYYLKLR